MSWLSDIFLPSGAMTSEEQQANYERLQKLEQERIAQREAIGDLRAEDRAYYESNTGPLENQDAAAWEGAKEGAAEGLQNVLDAPGQAVGLVGQGAGTLLGGVLKNIPWWVYVGAAAALFVWMGGLSLLRGRLVR